MNNGNGIFTSLHPQMEKDIEEHTLLTKFNKKYAKEKVLFKKVTTNIFKEINVRSKIRTHNAKEKNDNQSFKMKNESCISNNSKTIIAPKDRDNKRSTDLMYNIKYKQRQRTPQVNNHHFKYDSLLLSNKSEMNGGFCSSDHKSSKTSIINQNNNSKSTTLKSTLIPKPISLKSSYKKRIILKSFMHSDKDKGKKTLRFIERNSLNKFQSNKTPLNSCLISFSKDRITFKRKERKRNDLTETIFQSLGSSSFALLKNMNKELTQMIKDNNKDQPRRSKVSLLLLDEDAHSKIMIKEEFRNEYEEHLNSGDNYKRIIKYNDMKHQLDLISRITPEIVYKQRNYLEGRIGFEIDKDAGRINNRAKSTIKRYLAKDKEIRQLSQSS